MVTMKMMLKYKDDERPSFIKLRGMLYNSARAVNECDETKERNN